jgi:ribosomal protein S27AE
MAMATFSVSEMPKVSVERPACPQCGWPMWIARIEPTDNADHDQRTFECPRCDHSEVRIVKYR